MNEMEILQKVANFSALTAQCVTTLLVKVERRGPFVYYEIADVRILQILAALKDLATDLLAARTTF